MDRLQHQHTAPNAPVAWFLFSVLAVRANAREPTAGPDKNWYNALDTLFLTAPYSNATYNRISAINPHANLPSTILDQLCSELNGVIIQPVDRSVLD